MYPNLSVYCYLQYIHVKYHVQLKNALLNLPFRLDYCMCDDNDNESLLAHIEKYGACII